MNNELERMWKDQRGLRCGTIPMFSWKVRENRKLSLRPVYKNKSYMKYGVEIFPNYDSLGGEGVGGSM